MLSKYLFKTIMIAAVLVLIAILVPAAPVSADGPPSTSVTILKMAVDGVTVNRELTLTYQQMESTLNGKLPVQGDGETHYYHQGPVFKDDPDPDTEAMLRWNPEEDDSLTDFGAVKGTLVPDLCDLVGGMKDGETLKFIGTDGWTSKTFVYKNVYNYSPREGPMVLTWNKDGKYPDNGYAVGMRVVWFADTSVNPWGYHVFGHWDFHETIDPQSWYYYTEGKEEYPSARGLSCKYTSQIIINSSDPPWWDCNGDRTCDIGDMEVIGSQWGAEGDPGWIPQDVNQDGVVNILDVVKVGLNWGKKY
jgi:hypothetical protein